MEKCLTCAKEFKKIGRQKYCSIKCQKKDYYLTHKRKIINRVRNWENNNPEKRKIDQKKMYEKFKAKGYYRKYYKDKWHNDYKYRIKQQIRILHGQIRKRLIKQNCEFCGTTENLQLHHIDYENTVNTSKVQTLCKNCHNNLHKIQENTKVNL